MFIVGLAKDVFWASVGWVRMRAEDYVHRRLCKRYVGERCHVVSRKTNTQIFVGTIRGVVVADIWAPEVTILNDLFDIYRTPARALRWHKKAEAMIAEVEDA